MGSSALSVTPSRTQLTLMSEQLSRLCLTGRAEHLQACMWMCEHHNISPMGSFHTWIHCLRKDFGIIKNIIPPHRICFLLLLQMADCFESFQCLTAREEVAITNSKNSWRLPKWVLEDGISCYLLKDFWNYIHTLLCFSGHRIPNAAFC